MGRKPGDLVDPATMNPEHLTSTPTKQDLLNENIQKLVMKTHLEARDLAEEWYLFLPIFQWENKCFIGNKIRANFCKDEISKMVEGGDNFCDNNPMVVIITGTSILQVNASKLRRPSDTADLEESPDSCERTGALVFSLSCEDQTDVWELFSDNFYLSAILDRQGLMVATQVDLRIKKADSFSLQLLQGFWSRIKRKNPKNISDVTNCIQQIHSSERSDMATVPTVLAQGRISNSRWQTFPYSRTQVRKYLVVEEVQSNSEEVSLPMDSLARKATQVEFFIILAIFYNHLSLYRLRVREWFQQNGKFVQFLEIVYRRRKWFQFKRHSIGNLRWSVTSWILQIRAYERKQHWPRIGSRTDLKYLTFRL